MKVILRSIKYPELTPRGIFSVLFRSARTKFARATKGENSHSPLWKPHCVGLRAYARSLQDIYYGKQNWPTHHSF